MITHDLMWRGVDVICKRMGISRAELARRSGLDATSFHPCRRINPDGSGRWPRSGTLAKMLNAISMTMSEFAALCEGQDFLPDVELVQREADGKFSSRKQAAPWLKDGFLYQCQRTEKIGDLKKGGSLIVDARWAPRQGDEVFIATNDGRTFYGVFSHETTDDIIIDTIKPIPKTSVVRKGRVVFKRG